MKGDALANLQRWQADGGALQVIVDSPAWEAARAARDSANEARIANSKATTANRIAIASAVIAIVAALISALVLFGQHPH